MRKAFLYEYVVCCHSNRYTFLTSWQRTTIIKRFIIRCRNKFAMLLHFYAGKYNNETLWIPNISCNIYTKRCFCIELYKYKRMHKNEKRMVLNLELKFPVWMKKWKRICNGKPEIACPDSVVIGNSYSLPEKGTRLKSFRQFIKKRFCHLNGGLTEWLIGGLRCLNFIF